MTAEDERLEAILPLVKKYDAAVIALPNDHDEIPMEADKRVELTAKIVRVATQEYGIAIEDIVIDPLAMPIGADSSVVESVRAADLLLGHDEWGGRWIAAHRARQAAAATAATAGAAAAAALEAAPT